MIKYKKKGKKYMRNILLHKERKAKHKFKQLEQIKKMTHNRMKNFSYILHKKSTESIFFKSTSDPEVNQHR